jgi:hypothetical protein
MFVQTIGIAKTPRGSDPLVDAQTAPRGDLFSKCGRGESETNTQSFETGKEVSREEKA